MSAGPSGRPPRSASRGWLRRARRCPSPNFSSRAPGEAVSLLVVHGISLPPGEFGGPYVDQLFCNALDTAAHPYFATLPAGRVSAHLLIDRRGALTQYVALDDAAWHSGESCFGGAPDCNRYSVGVELEGADEVPYTDAQYRALSALARLLIARYPALSAQRVVGHCDIAPGRKTDPGPAFDWPRLRAALRA